MKRRSSFQISCVYGLQQYLATACLLDGFTGKRHIRCNTVVVWNTYFIRSVGITLPRSCFIHNFHCTVLSRSQFLEQSTNKHNN